MKKVLTLLLCVAIVFTFSFSSAFATGETYAKSDWSTSLQAKLQEISDNLEGTYKTTVLNSFTFNDEGYVNANLSGKPEDGVVAGWTKETISKVLDDIIDTMEDQMNMNMDSFLNHMTGDTFDREDTADNVKAVLQGTLKSGEYEKFITVNPTEAGLEAALKTSNYAVDNWETKDDSSDDVTVLDKLNEYQVEATYDYIVKTKLAVDLSTYDDESEDYYYHEPANSKKGKAVGINSVTAAEVIGTVDKAQGSGQTTADKITAAEAMDKLINDAKDAMSDAKLADYPTTGNGKDANQLAAYEAIYLAWDGIANDGDNKVPSKEDSDYNDATSGTTIEDAIAAYAKHGYEQAAALVNGTWGSDKTRDWKSAANSGVLSAFWEPTSGTGSKASKDGELFGVKIADINKVTRTEGVAVYNAMKDEVTKSKNVIAKWIDEEGLKGKDAKDAIEGLYTDNSSTTIDTTAPNKEQATEQMPKDTKFLGNLDKAMDLQDLYEDVVSLGDKLKAKTLSGIKQYNDAKVDEAVKDAEGKTYAHITDLSVKDLDEEDMIIAAANDIYDNHDGLKNLKEDAAKQGLENFDQAVDDAIALMWDTYDTVHGTYKPAAIVKTGADKTADDELVYKKDTYASEETKYTTDNRDSDWGDIADGAASDLLKAQSYDEIESILAQAKADFGELLTKENEDAVLKARDAYKDALEGYFNQCYNLLDSKTAYSKAYANGNYNNSDLKGKAEDEINDANTVEAVKEAYATAQNIIASAKSNDELKALKNAATKLINALPAEDKITSADLPALKEAYEAVVAYCDEAGADDTMTNGDTLRIKYQKAIDLYADELEDEAEALWDKMDDVNTGSDADLAKYAAYKAEAQALIDKIDDINDDVDDVNDNNYITYTADLTGITKNADETKIDNALVLNRDDVEVKSYNPIWATEVENAQRLLVEASKPGATAADIKAAQDAYNALTQRQQLYIDEDPYYYNLVEGVMAKEATSVEEIKIIAKSVAKKGSITVTWKIKSGDTTGIDGYEVWKSTKHSKGYKKAFTTTKKSYKNTKGLKTGVRYYYKVRAYKVIDGTKYTSDWSNKARRIAK